MLISSSSCCLAILPISSYLPEFSYLVVSRLLPALALTTAFALAAWGMRAVSASGALAGLFVTFVISISAGLGAFLAVFTVFLLTFIATRLGISRKMQTGVAEHPHGRRASQIFANLGAATMCAAPLIIWPSQRGLLLGVVAALAEAAADTVSSEVGQAFARRPVLITNFQLVPPGTDGGVSGLGTLAGFAGAVIVIMVCLWSNLIYGHWFGLIVLSAMVGMLLDSFLGATLERSGKIGNDTVNFVSSSISAFLALGIWLILQLSQA